LNRKAGPRLRAHLDTTTKSGLLAESWLWHPHSGVRLSGGRFPVVASKARDAPATLWQLFELLFWWRYQDAPLTA
jgi:hypothetical protein